MLDTNLTKSVATWEQLVQEYDKPIVPGFGSLQSYIISSSYIPFEQENELECCWSVLDPPIRIAKPRGGHRNPLAPSTSENNPTPRSGKVVLRQSY